ncbi:MAG TPA: serine/threonine-protein kinase, partial [Polyangiaceae bacterium]|nr:serine/threonine-protein kinase [Polyangiaceae bacterium]
MSSAVASFRLKELFPIGRGGMGTTYLACAWTTSFERLVVVKRLNEHLADEADARQRMLEESRLSGYVHHANVVGIHHAGIDERGSFIVLDYVEGASLRELLKATRPERLPVPIALRVMVDCLAGLHAIHTARDTRGGALRILHRDVTPENILIGLDGLARLGDFGIAKSRQSAVHTSPLQLVGKLPFLAPEYIDRAEVGPELDVYSSGVTLWRLLAGRTPWPDLEEAQLLVRILTEGVPPLPDDVELSDELRAVVARACARRPGDRFPSAEAFADALHSLSPQRPGEPAVAESSQVAELVYRVAGARTEALRERAAQLLGTPSLPPSAPPPTGRIASAPARPFASELAASLEETPELEDPPRSEESEPPAISTASRYLETTRPARYRVLARRRAWFASAAGVLGILGLVAAFGAQRLLGGSDGTGSRETGTEGTAEATVSVPPATPAAGPAAPEPVSAAPPLDSTSPGPASPQPA